jgi:hypothetical protein
MHVFYHCHSYQLRINQLRYTFLILSTAVDIPAGIKMEYCRPFQMEKVTEC